MKALVSVVVMGPVAAGGGGGVGLAPAPPPQAMVTPAARVLRQKVRRSRPRDGSTGWESSSGDTWPPWNGAQPTIQPNLPADQIRSMDSHPSGRSAVHGNRPSQSRRSPATGS